jgi:hypothetical protein
LDYVPWQEDGCTLAQTRERVADRVLWTHRKQLMRELECLHTGKNGRVETEFGDLEKKIDTNCLEHLNSRRLIAYGTRGPAGAARLINGQEWPTFTSIDWNNSAVSDGQSGAVSLSNIRVFPPLLAPCRVDLLAGHSLAEAFRRFVLEEAEVGALAKEAVRLAPEYRRIFEEGRCHVLGFAEWPLAFHRWSMIGIVHPDPMKRSKFAVARKPDPIEVVIAAEALLERYRALVSMLRNGELEGRGLPAVPGPPEPILHSIWSHEEFHFDAVRGDILQDNLHSTDRYDRLVRRWIGVVLQRGASAEAGIASSDQHPASLPVAAQTGATSGDNCPFTVADVIEIGSLTEALARLVFNHPDVRRLCENAMLAAKRERTSVEGDAGLIGRVYGHEQPLMPLRYFQGRFDRFLAPPLHPPSQEEDASVSEFYEPKRRPEIDAYYDAVNLRANTLIEMLQDEVVLALGHTGDGHLVTIAHSIWSHEDYYVHPPTGDVYEAGFGDMAKRWTGVILRSPSAARAASALFHVKPRTFDEVPRSTIEAPNSFVKPSKAIARVETSSASYKACVGWLVEIMRASPTVRSQSSAMLWKEAREKWGRTLSQRSFLDARTEAVRTTGAAVWAAAGAPKKSPPT